MKIGFTNASVGNGLLGSISVVPVFEDKDIPPAATALDAATDGQLSKAIGATKFSGEAGSEIQIAGPMGVNTARIVLIGCGNRSDFDAEIFGGKVAKLFWSSGETKLILHLDGMELSATDAARSALGAELACYRFSRYLTKKKDTQKYKLTAIRIATDSPAKAKTAHSKFYGPVGAGVALARDLVSEPPNKLYPKSYAAKIKKMKELGLKVEILGEKKMKELKMGALLGVGKGSSRESQIAIIRWDGGKKGEKPVCLIGKGVTFDSGGISIKPSNGMSEMKGDMAGSAAVVGAMHIIAARRARANVVALVGLVENMPGGNAQNPGDIVTSMSGQTVEVLDTDAEGRLILCDLLWYAKKRFKPVAMADFATLTGAVMVALGKEYAGLFSNNDKIAEQFLEAGEESGEKTWRLPLDPNYDKMIDSPIADMKNLGGRFAGSCTAAQFLNRFVGDTPWAHLDIAGVAWQEKSSDPRQPTWATGYGARLINQWIAKNYEG